MKRFSLTATVWEEGVYVSKCPELGVASCGDTPEEALSNLKEAAELYLDNAKELGLIVDVETALTSPHKFTSIIEVTAGRSCQ
ncbi:MAG: type II toxin-antitoxin system HicB family antitoxin [Methanomicrobia archaeon]|nr:type II toxin-antitoxin system HicB family antitoxin [Methanomicrobia archaeon]